MTSLLPLEALDPAFTSQINLEESYLIDPKLLQIENLVKQCNLQLPVSFELYPEALEPVQPPPVQLPVQPIVEEELQVEMEEEGIDPALREIVDHLAREQQEHAFHPLHLRQQAMQLVPQAERDRDAHALQQSLQTTLDDLAQVSFDYTPYFNEPEAAPLTTSMKRPRGRPKGSKNKPRDGMDLEIPEVEESTLQSEEPEKKKRGRPFKVRTPEDQAEYERRKAEKEAGITKRRGRPRKNPDYLVRENRSKKLRALREQEAREKEEREMHSVFSLPDGGLDFGDQ